MATAKKILTKDAVPRVLQSASARQSRAQNPVVATCSDDEGERGVRGPRRTEVRLSVNTGESTDRKRNSESPSSERVSSKTRPATGALQPAGLDQEISG